VYVAVLSGAWIHLVKNDWHRFFVSGAHICLLAGVDTGVHC
jgi:hypothetical protein